MKLFYLFAVLSLFIQVDLLGQTDMADQLTGDFVNADGFVVYSIFDVNDREEMKKMDALAQKYKLDQIQFVAVKDKVNHKAKKIVEENSKYYLHLSQKANHKVFNPYQTEMMKIFPIHVVVDSNGHVVFKKKGQSKGIDIKLEKRIEKILKSYPEYNNDLALVSEQN